jgi:DNA-binding GntR family transcriptional regulator
MATTMTTLPPTEAASQTNAPWDYLSLTPVPAGDEGEMSRSEATYNNIKRLILSGQLRPGRKLVHQDLAELLKVSRTPVREALERLYQEDFVTRLPRRGFYVAEMTADEAFELYGAREALEVHALRDTFTKSALTPAVLEELGALVGRYHTLLQERVVKERVVTDVKFHLRLAELAGNRYLVRLLTQTFERLTLKRRVEGYRSDRGAQASSEHSELLGALNAHDLPRAESALRTHISRARDALLESLKEI